MEALFYMFGLILKVSWTVVGDSRLPKPLRVRSGCFWKTETEKRRQKGEAYGIVWSLLGGSSGSFSHFWRCFFGLCFWKGPGSGLRAVWRVLENAFEVFWKPFWRKVDF